MTAELDLAEPWGSLIHDWSRFLRAENKSPRTIRGYVDAARWMHTWLAEQPGPPRTAAEITVRHVRDWIAHRLDTTSPGNAHNNYRALQQWFNYLLDEEEITAHPMMRMKPPAVPEQPVPVIPDQLMTAVLASCTGADFLDRRDAAIIRLIWDTGGRLGEIADLCVHDVDRTVDAIRVTGKGGKQRVIPYSPKTGRALARYLRMRAQQGLAGLDHLWLADRNKGRLHANGIRLMLRRRGQVAGVNDAIGRNLHAHLGRHYMAHHAQANGIQEGDLMLLAGWTSPQMPKRYGRSAATERAHAAARNLRLGDRL